MRGEGVASQAISTRANAYRKRGPAAGARTRVRARVLFESTMLLRAERRRRAGVALQATQCAGYRTAANLAVQSASIDQRRHRRCTR